MTQTLDRTQIEEVPQRELTDIEERVQRGAAFLDATEPPGWEWKIDLAVLDLSSITGCILGQVKGSFIAAYVEYHQGKLGGHDWTDLVSLHARSHGFSARSHDDIVKLAVYWRDVICARRGETV